VITPSGLPLLLSQGVLSGAHTEQAPVRRARAGDRSGYEGDQEEEADGDEEPRASRGAESSSSSGGSVDRLREMLAAKAQTQRPGAPGLARPAEEVDVRDPSAWLSTAKAAQLWVGLGRRVGVPPSRGSGRRTQVRAASSRRCSWCLDLPVSPALGPFLCRYQAGDEAFAAFCEEVAAFARPLKSKVLHHPPAASSGAGPRPVGYGSKVLSQTSWRALKAIYGEPDAGVTAHATSGGRKKGLNAVGTERSRDAVAALQAFVDCVLLDGEVLYGAPAAVTAAAVATTDGGMAEGSLAAVRSSRQQHDRMALLFHIALADLLRARDKVRQTLPDVDALAADTAAAGMDPTALAAHLASLLTAAPAPAPALVALVRWHRAVVAEAVATGTLASGAAAALAVGCGDVDAAVGAVRRRHMTVAPWRVLEGSVLRLVAFGCDARATLAAARRRPVPPYGLDLDAAIGAFAHASAPGGARRGLRVTCSPSAALHVGDADPRGRGYLLLALCARGMWDAAIHLVQTSMLPRGDDDDDNDGGEGGWGYEEDGADGTDPLRCVHVQVPPACRAPFHCSHLHPLNSRPSLTSPRRAAT